MDAQFYIKYNILNEVKYIYTQLNYYNTICNSCFNYFIHKLWWLFFFLNNYSV